MLDQPISKIMTRNVIYAEVPGTREEVIDKMNEFRKTGFPVVKRGSKTIVGIVTLTDILKKPEEEQIALLMTRDPITVNPETMIIDAIELFIKNNIRRIPVVDKEKQVVGILSIFDIVTKVIARMDISKPIKEFVKRNITCIWYKTPINVAYKIMHLANTKFVPVINNEGDVVGVLSDFDFFKLLEIEREEKKSSVMGPSEDKDWSWNSSAIIYILKKTLKLPHDKTVSEIMIKDVIFALEATSISECAKKIRKYNIDQLPVKNADGELCGIIHDRDLLKTIFSEKS